MAFDSALPKHLESEKVSHSLTGFDSESDLVSEKASETESHSLMEFDLALHSHSESEKVSHSQTESDLAS